MKKKLEDLFKKLPPKYKQEVRQEALYARKENVEVSVMKAALTISSTILLLSLLSPYSTMLTALITITSLATLPLGLPLIVLRIMAERRKTSMETVLPDGLKLISANMEAGHTIEKAFMISARDELGELSDELRQTAMEMYGGKPIGESLHDMQMRVKSELLKETLKLLADANEAGGDMSKLLSSSADDVRESIEMKEEIKSSIRMYAVFIIMVATIFGPILFAVSLHTAEITQSMWDDADMDEDMDLGGGGQIGLDISFEPPNININLFENFALAALIMTNIFASLIISEIRNGNVTNGFKYIPLLVPLALTIFIGVSFGVGELMSLD